jgi:hypothetical protein
LRLSSTVSFEQPNHNEDETQQFYTITPVKAADRNEVLGCAAKYLKKRTIPPGLVWEPV